MTTTTTAPTNCATCQKPLTHAPHQGRRRTYCSLRCWRTAYYGYVKPIVTCCKNCGRVIVHDQHRGGRTRLHCSEHCRRFYDLQQKTARVAAQKASLV